MNDKYIKYSIIIPTYKITIPLFEKNIDSIYENLDMYNKEVIVVSNGQSPDFNNYFRKKSEELGFIFLEYDKPLGYAVAVNKGIMYSSGDYIILLNDDCEFYKSFKKDIHIMLLKEPFDMFDNVGITGLSIHNFGRYSRNKRLIFKPFILFFLAMIRRDLLIDFGLLNEIFDVGGYEDSEFCFRLEKFGYKFYMVPYDRQVPYSYITIYPFYHLGSYTVKDLKEHDEAVERNFWKAYELAKSEYTDIYINDLRKLFDDRVYNKVMKHIELYKLKNKNNLKICEIGCRNGIILKYLNVNGIDYYGYDIDDRMIYVSQKNWKYNNVNFCYVDDYKKVFYDRNFINSDIVISLDVFNTNDWLEIENRLKGKNYIIKFKNSDKLLVSLEMKNVFLDVNVFNDLFFINGKYIINFIVDFINNYDNQFILYFKFSNIDNFNKFIFSNERITMEKLLKEKNYNFEYLF